MWDNDNNWGDNGQEHDTNEMQNTPVTEEELFSQDTPSDTEDQGTGEGKPQETPEEPVEDKEPQIGEEVIRDMMTYDKDVQFSWNDMVDFAVFSINYNAMNDMSRALLSAISPEIKKNDSPFVAAKKLLEDDVDDVALTIISEFIQKFDEAGGFSWGDAIQMSSTIHMLSTERRHILVNVSNALFDNQMRWRKNLSQDVIAQTLMENIAQGVDYSKVKFVADLLSIWPGKRSQEDM